VLRDGASVRRGCFDGDGFVVLAERTPAPQRSAWNFIHRLRRFEIQITASAKIFAGHQQSRKPDCVEKVSAAETAYHILNRIKSVVPKKVSSVLR